MKMAIHPLREMKTPPRPTQECPTPTAGAAAARQLTAHQAPDGGRTR